MKKKYNSVAYTTIIKHKKIDNNIAAQIFTKRDQLHFYLFQIMKLQLYVHSILRIENFKYRHNRINK